MNKSTKLVLEKNNNTDTDTDTDTNTDIISSEYQTKKWRKKQDWYKSGKHNECEKYQLDKIKAITNFECKKPNERIYKMNNTISFCKNPYKNDDGFEWTEDFDGKIILNNSTYYFNLKFVCDNGGAQIRTLKEVYDFVKAQFNYLSQNKSNNIYFINILDGDTSYKHMSKFNYIIDKNKEYKKYVYVYDLDRFKKNWNKIIN